MGLDELKYGRRVLLNRVASLLGVMLLLPVIGGCSSDSLRFSDLGQGGANSIGATGSVPIPSEPVYGVRDRSGNYADNSDKQSDVTPTASYGGATTAATYQPASVQRSALTPVRAEAGAYDSQSGNAQYADNSKASGPYLGNSFAMQPVEAHRPSNQVQTSAYWKKPDREQQPQRVAQSYDDYRGASRYRRDYEPREDYRPRKRSHSAEPYDGKHDDQLYIVVAGDTLYSIAKHHGLSTHELIALNDLGSTTIVPGQELRVGAYGGGKPKRHYVRKAPKHDYRDAEPDYVEPEPEPDYAADDHRKSPPPTDYDRGGSRSDYTSAYNRRMPAYGSAKAGASDYDADGQDAYGRAGKKRQDDDYEEKRGKHRFSGHDYTVDKNDRDYSEEKKYASRKPYRDEQPKHYKQRDERDYTPRKSKRDHGDDTHRHSVQRGDTLSGIARQYGLDHRELAEYNDIPLDGTLYPGQVLHIPGGAGHDGKAGYEAEEDDYVGRPKRRPAQYDDRYSQKPSDDAQPEEVKVARLDEPTRDAGPETRNDAQPIAREERRVPQTEPVEQPVLAEERAEPHNRTAVMTTEPQPEEVPAAEQDVAAATPANAPFSSQSCESLLENPMPRSSDKFRMPVHGVISAKFGTKEDGSFNDGVDFAVPKGTPVKAAENGIVAYAGEELAGFGKLVLIRHADGFVTAYAHNDEMLVKRCDVVKRGQTIAKAGATGKVTHPQLHFELRKESKPVDPTAYLSRS